MNVFTFQPAAAEGGRVTAYLQTEVPGIVCGPRPAVVICPGGGYAYTSEREAEPVAKKYYAAGYHAFVLDYSVGEAAKGFKPLLELAGTLSYIRSHAAEWNVAPDKIAVCGFSAGAHLAASIGTLYNEDKFRAVCPDLGNIRPDAMILGYPVITADEFAHVGSIETVSGAKEGSEAYRWFGLDQHVDQDTPQTFLWHTAPDSGVPVENSLLFAAALSKAKVPFELHIFPEGGHGMSVCNREVNAYNPYNARWMEFSIAWLNKIFAFEE